MKLHLPKLLLVAVLSAFSFPAMGVAFTTADIKTPTEGGDSYLNVGMENATDTWAGDMVVGDTANVQGDVDKVGAFNDSWGFITPNGGGSNTTITSGLKISGNLTIQGSGKMVLGGQYKGGGSFLGLEATESITVTGGSLTSTKVVTKNLTVSGGTVSTNTGNCTSGNSYAAGPKQSYIKESLTISGGSLSFGYKDNVQGIGVGTHRQTAFGSSADFTLTQTGGTLRVYADMDLKSGSTISQSDGTMVLRDTIYMGGGGTTTINQSGDTSSLVLGRLESTGNLAGVCEFDINQNGGGLIHLAYGSNFAKDSTISLTQTGTGTINIGGKHDTSITGPLPSRGYELDNSPFEAIRTTYAIDQGSGSIINVKTAGQVKVSTASIKGLVNVAKDATFGVVFNEMKDSAKAYITVTDGDTSTTEDGWNMNSGSAFGINFSQVVLDMLTAADDVAATSEIDFAFNLWVATGAAEEKLLNTEFKLVDMDERLWTLKDGAKWVQNDTDTYVTGTVEYNHWIKVTKNTSEDFSDVSDFLKVGLDIDGNDVKLSGKNTHSYGTKINNAIVTLGSASALGKGPVSTSGTTTLAGYKSGTYSSLPCTIQNSGSLTLTGRYNVNDMEVNHYPEKIVDAYGETGKNGFTYYESFSVQVVENGTNAELKLGDDFLIKYGSLTGEMVTESGTYTGEATFGGGADYATYLMTDAEHSVSVSKIQEASGNQTTTVKLIDGTLTVDADIDIDAEGGTVLIDPSAELDGTLEDVDVDATGGTISADIIGTSDVTVTGDTTLTGDNTYTGDTVIKGATLKLAENTGVGTGDVELTSTDDGCGVFDMGGNSLTNKLIVTGCTIRNAQNYDGEMEVSHELVVEGVAKSRKVTLLGEGTLVREAQLGGSMTTDAIDVQTTGDAALDVDLTINDNGTVTLNDGKVLGVNGSLTLAGATTLTLNGDYAVGDKLLTGNDSLEEGAITLVYNDSTVELERIGNSIVLVSKFKQDKADMAAQSNWGIATASRAFVNTVRGQHSHTGCIGNGRGTVWAAVLGAYNDMDGADISVQGAAVGVDAKVGSRSTVGIAAGYTDGEVSPAGLRDVDQEGNYVALYGEHGLKKLGSNSCLSLDWVAAYGQTESKANGLKWEQDSLQLNTRLNWNKKMTDRLCMSVFGGLEYFATGSDTSEGVKSGSIQNLRGEIGVGARYVAWGAPGAAASYDEKGAMVTASRPGCEKLVLNGEIRYFNDMVRSNPVIEMDGLRGDGENPGRYGMGIEAGATYRIGERWSASANYSFNAMEDSTEHRVNVGASYTF